MCSVQILYMYLFFGYDYFLQPSRTFQSWTINIYIKWHEIICLDRSKSLVLYKTEKRKGRSFVEKNTTNNEPTSCFMLVNSNYTQVQYYFLPGRVDVGKTVFFSVPDIRSRTTGIRTLLPYPYIKIVTLSTTCWFKYK